jgi:hypothetical protein
MFYFLVFKVMQTKPRRILNNPNINKVETLYAIYKQVQLPKFHLKANR